MKIKRIFAQDMRQAIRKVREEHGPEAVILSSRKVDGGVEVISAVDYDERAIQQAVDRGRAFATDSQVRTGRGAPADFAATLRQTQRRDKATGTRPPGRRKLDVVVSDDADTEADDKGLTFQVESEPTPPIPPAASAPPPSLPPIEWTQEPALVEMRQELKTLRTLFESQLTLLDWQQNARRNPVRTLVLKQLAAMGFGPDVCRKLADHIKQLKDADSALQQALRVIAKHTPVTDDDILDRGGVVAMVGPTGVGKTTSVAKLAARFALRHGRQHVALVSTDNFRIGAQDQLRNFARILGVPVYTAGTAEELATVLDDLASKRLVLIDTAGMSQRDLRLAQHFRTFVGSNGRVRSFLVLSATTQLSTLCETVRTFKQVEPAGCILTKVDEATSLGAVLTAVLRYRLPVGYLGTGQRVPEDLQQARGDKLVETAHGLARRYQQETDEEALALTFGGTTHAHS